MQKHLQHPVFKAISEIANINNKEVYVIGGFVRDLILKRHTNDIDVVVVGNGIDLAEETAKKLGGLKVSVFKSFGTAMFRYRNIEVEFVGARKESYD